MTKSLAGGATNESFYLFSVAHGVEQNLSSGDIVCKTKPRVHLVNFTEWFMSMDMS